MSLPFITQGQFYFTHLAPNKQSIIFFPHYIFKVFSYTNPSHTYILSSFLSFHTLSSISLFFFFLYFFVHYQNKGKRNFSKQKMLWDSIRANMYHTLLCCSFVVSLLILFTTKAHTRLSPFLQILTKDLIHTWLSYTTKRKILLKNSLSSRWKSCEFLRLSCCRFPSNARM
jgi:hypothetical protein